MISGDLSCASETEQIPATDATPDHSLVALDWLNFFLADVQQGLGPYLAIYLSAVRRWDPGKIGMAMAAMSIAQVVAQTPAGALIDWIKAKRSAIMIASILVGLGALSIPIYPRLGVILAAQVAIGFSAAIFPPAIAAISLGLVGRAALARRQGRNEAFNHAGNVAAAIGSGLIGDLIAYEGIFVFVSVFSILTVISTLMIRADKIDHTLARGSLDASRTKTAGVGEVLCNWPIVSFIVALTLFHFANAAMLPLVGQKLTAGHSEGASSAMSACIIAAQLVMVPVALISSRKAETWGRKPILLIAFAVLPIRGLLYTLSVNPIYLVGVQLLDGIGAGILGVVGVLIVADLTKGTGRFNLVQGAQATAIGLGSGLSHFITGYIVKIAGFDSGFIFLSVVALSALTFCMFTVSETLAPRQGARPLVDLHDLP